MKVTKQFFKGFFRFVKNMLSTGTSESSKRTMGVLIIINTIIIAYICVFSKSQAPEIVDTMFWGAIILLGVSVAPNIINGLKNSKK